MEQMNEITQKIREDYLKKIKCLVTEILTSKDADKSRVSMKLGTQRICVYGRLKYSSKISETYCTRLGICSNDYYGVSLDYKGEPAIWISTYDEDTTIDIKHVGTPTIVEIYNRLIKE